MRLNREWGGVHCLHPPFHPTPLIISEKLLYILCASLACVISYRNTFSCNILNGLSSYSPIVAFVWTCLRRYGRAIPHSKEKHITELYIQSICIFLFDPFLFCSWKILYNVDFVVVSLNLKLYIFGKQAHQGRKHE